MNTFVIDGTEFQVQKMVVRNDMHFAKLSVQTPHGAVKLLVLSDAGHLRLCSDVTTRSSAAQKAAAAEAMDTLATYPLWLYEALRNVQLVRDSRMLSRQIDNDLHYDGAEEYRWSTASDGGVMVVNLLRYVAEQSLRIAPDDAAWRAEARASEEAALKELSESYLPDLSPYMMYGDE